MQQCGDRKSGNFILFFSLIEAKNQENLLKLSVRLLFIEVISI